MRNLIKLTFLLLSFGITFYSCSDDSSTELEQTIESKIKAEDILKEKYGIMATDLGNGNFEFLYPNGESLNIQNINGNFLISGSRISNKSFGLKINEEGFDFNEKFELTDTTFKKSITHSDLAQIVNNKSFLAKRTFGECFKEEWNSFCEDFVSCLAQITNPQAIAAAIVIACSLE